MKISYNWLRDFLTTDLAPEAAATILTDIGLEVEGMETHGTDTVIEIGLTPNRIDAASHYGVARDLCAVWGKKAVFKSAECLSGTGMPIKVRVENSAAAPRYAGITIKGCKVGPSPAWMQERLQAVGLTPKNNLVDVTNYVMLELGQPLHAFDADKIAGGEIVVKTCAEGTPFTTLDGVARKLTAQDLMICSAEKPMCIAGVLGGLESGVSEKTTTIFIESAYFDPVWVRKTAKRFGINTDASFRFERGIDPNITLTALRRATQLVLECAGGEVVGEEVDIYPSPIPNHVFEVDFERINKLLGVEIPREKVLQILEALEIKLTGNRVEVPAYRVDVTREADLAEEILRIYGYNNVPVPSHVRSTLSYVTSSRHALQNTASDFLSSRGFTEIMSNSLTKSAYYPDSQTLVRLLNPLSSDLDAMRQTLLHNALEAIQLNTNHKNADLKLYEFGNVYFHEGGEKYRQEHRLGIAVTGLATLPSWNEKAEPSTFYHLRGAVEQLLARFGLDIYDLPDPGIIVSMDEVTGQKNKVYFAELNFDKLIAAVEKQRIQVRELSKYPSVRRDLALLVDEGVTFQTLREIAFATEKKLLTNVSLFDVYEGDKLPAGKKSYALAFTLVDPSQTLTDTQIDAAMANLTRAFAEKTNAQIRS